MFGVVDPLLHRKEYGDTPPETVKLIDDVESPKHTVSLIIVEDNGNWGSVILNNIIVSQRLISVTVQVYVPTDNPVAVAVVCIGIVFHT